MSMDERAVPAPLLSQRTEPAIEGYLPMPVSRKIRLCVDVTPDIFGDESEGLMNGCGMK